MSTTQVAPAERSFQYLGNQVRIHAAASDTGGAYSLLEFLVIPGSEPPMHFHENEDELFIVLEGEMQLTCDGRQRILRAGESAMAKRGMPHTFRVLSPFMRSFTVFTPAGFEDFFRALAGDPPPSNRRIAEVAAQFGSHVIF